MGQTQDRTIAQAMPEEHVEERSDQPRHFCIDLLEPRVAPVAIWGE